MSPEREMRALLKPSFKRPSEIDWPRVARLAKSHGRAALSATIGRYQSRAIHLAAAACDVSVVRKLLAAGEDADVRRGDDYSPMHCAAMNDGVAVMKLLLRRGVSAECVARAGNGFTPLMAAAAAGRIAAVAWLLDDAKVQVDGITSERVSYSTALMEAASRGLYGVVAVLIDRKADVNDLRLDDGESALSLAAGYGHDDVVSLLLKRGALVNFVNYLNGYSALHHAVAAGHGDVVQTLIGNRAKIRLPAHNGLSPVSLASPDSNMLNTVLAAHVYDDKKYVEPISRYPSRPFVKRKDRTDLHLALV